MHCAPIRVFFGVMGTNVGSFGIPNLTFNFISVELDGD